MPAYLAVVCKSGLNHLRFHIENAQVKGISVRTIVQPILVSIVRKCREAHILQRGNSKSAGTEGKPHRSTAGKTQEHPSIMNIRGRT